MTQHAAADDISAQIDDETLANAAEADVDVDAILETVAEERAAYSAATQARFAQSELERQIDTADSESINGILMGSRDRYGKNWPRRYSLVRSNGEHVEVSAWSGSLPGPKGGEVDLTPGSIAALGCQFDDEYEDWQAKRVESLTPLDGGELAEKLAGVAVAPSELSRSDEYEIVVVRGTIRFVNAQTLFVDGEPADDGPVLMSDGREPPEDQPHLEIALDDDGGTRVRGHLERQRYGRPHVALPEIDMLLEDAIDQGGPEAQASFLQAALEGVEVVLVGNVNSVNVDRDREGETRTYVEVACTAVQALDDGAEPEAEPVVEEPEPKADIDDVVESIEMAASLQGADASELTPADVEQIAPALVEEHPETVISHALGVLAGDAPEPAESDDDDPLEAIREGGIYKCPGTDDGEDCLFQTGSEADLFAHIEGVHDPGIPQPEWVEEQL